jgi:hypothetical protein
MYGDPNLYKEAYEKSLMERRDFVKEATDEIARLRLTDEERSAIEVARRCLMPCHDDFDATLRALLERTK